MLNFGCIVKKESSFEYELLCLPPYYTVAQFPYLPFPLLPFLPHFLPSNPPCIAVEEGRGKRRKRTRKKGKAVPKKKKGEKYVVDSSLCLSSWDMGSFCYYSGLCYCPFLYPLHLLVLPSLPPSLLLPFSPSASPSLWP